MTEGEDRDGWLAKRRIGSSDAANVCGIEGAFATPLEAYLEKIGALRRKQTDAMEMGLLLEPVVAQLYQRETGDEVRLTTADGKPQSYYADAFPWASATPDRFAGPEGQHWILELKIASIAKGWGEPGTDEVPLPYLIQVQHQMAVLGLDRADVAVLIAGTDFRHYTVRRHDDLIRQMMRLEADFWGMIQERRAPSIDWQHPDTPKLVSLLHQPVPKKTVTFGFSTSLLVEEYEHLGKTIGELEKRRELVKARVVDAMQDATFGELPDGRRVRRQPKPVKASTRPARVDMDFRIVKGENTKETGNVAVETEG
jgi:putative phage-type endonuclease